MDTLLAIHPVYEPVDAIDPIINLADEKKAHLNLVALGVLPPVLVAEYPGVLDAGWGESYNQVVNDTRERVRELEAIVQKAGQSASVTSECLELGQLETAIARHALYADLTLFSNHEIAEEGIARNIFYGAVFNTGRPALVLGPDTHSLPEFKRVVYAWDGRPEAAKALHHSLPWLRESAEANVLVVDPDGQQTGPNPGDDIAAYLARRKLKVTVDRVASAGQGIADVLIERARDFDADLIVMGAYGHSRFREWLLGGTTRGVLENVNIPVLMAH